MAWIPGEIERLFRDAKVLFLVALIYEDVNECMTLYNYLLLWCWPGTATINCNSALQIFCTTDAKEDKIHRISGVLDSDLKHCF